MDRKATVYVAALTFHRPDTLAQLLESFRNLELPEDIEVRFLIVDNDPEESACSVVESRIPHFAGQLDYLVEPEPGIPAARNRALDEAISSGGDLLCFIDDDAWPDRNWLRELVFCRRKTKAVLTFGPRRLVPPDHLDGLWRRFLARSLVSGASFVERFAAMESRKNRIITSGSGNSMADLRWIADHDIRFDTSMRDSGGEDTAFREAVRELDGRLAWCERAIIYENLPCERISLRYQFRRSRTHGINSARFNRKIFPAILRNPVSRIFAGIGLIVLPILGMASFALGLHMIGMGVGILQAKFGSKSNLYSRKT